MGNDDLDEYDGIFQQKRPLTKPPEAFILNGRDGKI